MYRSYKISFAKRMDIMLFSCQKWWFFFCLLQCVIYPISNIGLLALLFKYCRQHVQNNASCLRKQQKKQEERGESKIIVNETKKCFGHTSSTINSYRTLLRQKNGERLLAPLFTSFGSCALCDMIYLSKFHKILHRWESRSNEKHINVYQNRKESKV